jgi:hypothetical protein
MNHSAKIVSAIFYEHAMAAILAVSVIHAMKREQSRILKVSAILAVSVARVIWHDQGWVDYKIFVVRYNYSYFKNK